MHLSQGDFIYICNMGSFWFCTIKLQQTLQNITDRQSVIRDLFSGSRIKHVLVRGHHKGSVLSNIRVPLNSPCG